jgi:hypothetical protein
MGLHAIFYKLHGDPDLLFSQAKFLSIAFLVMNAGLIFAVSVSCGISRSLATLASISFSGSYVAIIESINGMENPLFLFYTASYLFRTSTHTLNIIFSFF